MKKRINIAELLKNCPRGMELYSPIFGKVYLDKIRPHLAIVVTDNDKELGDFREEFLYDGRYGMHGECMLFPSKENRDWSKFQRPFKDGDVLTYTGQYTTTFIYRNKDNEPHFATSFYVAYSSESPSHNFLIYNKYTLIALNENCDVRIATEEEKQKLFDAIKENGYKWNEETKTLEKLPKFKVGDRIRLKENHNYIYTITGIRKEENKYECGVTFVLRFSEQDNWELVPNKFDINTLKPFESRVLVRNVDGDLWKPAIYGFPHSKGCYVVGGVYWGQCIPYEENKELLGTTNNPEEYGSR
jgi:hypothetical protein